MAGAVDQATDRYGVALARPGQRAPDRDAGAAPPSVGHRAPAVPASADNADTAIERFHKYLADMAELRGRARGERTQQFLEELRAMGPAGVEVLTRVLGSNASSDERRAAAQLLGDLKAPGALPALMDVLGRDDDVLLRRTAASALRRLQTPDAAAAMQSLLSTPGEDRYVRMSAASGLAHMGRPQGTPALVQIFDEANADGRGRDMAFRSLTTLSDDRTLAFMRRVVTSDAELTYRLQAIRYLATQGDRQAVSALQQVVHAPGEQPSIRDAAARALATIGGS
jgi:HEAT repeat protein